MVNMTIGSVFVFLLHVNISQDFVPIDRKPIENSHGLVEYHINVILSLVSFLIFLFQTDKEMSGLILHT